MIDLLALEEFLDRLIRSVVPGVECVQKYGGVLYTLYPEEKEGQFCGLFVFKSHVQLSFSQGAALDDPAGLLAGNGKVRRHVNFETPEQIDETGLSALILQASKQSG